MRPFWLSLESDQSAPGDEDISPIRNKHYHDNSQDRIGK